MTKEMSPEELRVQDWLATRGYATEYEPLDIPDGVQRPDFWANAPEGDPPGLWVEVKQIDQDASSRVMSMAVRLGRSTKIPEDLFGEALIDVNEGTLEPAIRSVINLFRKKAPKYAREKTTLAFVQQHEGDSILRRAEVITSAGLSRLWVRGPDSGPLVCPHRFAAEDFGATVRFWRADGSEGTAPAYEVLDWTDDYQCALTAWLDPARPRIETFGVGSSGSSNTSERTTRLLKKANSQLRAAVAIRPAPAVVFLVPYYDYVDDQMIQAGCYGVLKVPINLKTGEAGQMYHGEDGVFRPTKNRHISAALRLWKNGEVTYFPNPFAHYPINDHSRLFQGLHRANVSFGPALR